MRADLVAATFGGGTAAQGRVMSNLSSAPNIERLTIRRQFLDVAQGRKASGRFVMLQARPTADAAAQARGLIRYGLTASKKVGQAVVRNRARRRLRVAMLRLLGEFGLAGMDYVAVARTASVTAKWADLLDDLTTLFIRLSQHGCAKRPFTTTPTATAAPQNLTHARDVH